MLGGLKEEAKRKKQSLSSLVEQTLHDSLFSLFHQPNETTKAAMREAEAGIELEELTAEDIDFYNEAKERLACSYSGDDMEIGFNSRFLQEMLSNFDSETIKIDMSAPNRAGIITPADNENEAEDLLMLLMPVMLN